MRLSGGMGRLSGGSGKTSWIVWEDCGCCGEAV